MIHASWKQRLIRYAHISWSQQIPVRNHWDFPKTVLGRKVLLRQTMNQNFDWLRKIKGEVLYNEPLAPYTSIRIGGPADILIFPDGEADLKTIFKNAAKTPVFILGEGSNLLIRDNGIRGIVVSLKESFKSAKDITFYEDAEDPNYVMVSAGAGVKISYLAKHTARNGLTGLEALVGIPGSLGGGIIMNAGAEGTEIGEFILTLTRITHGGRVQVLKRGDLTFQYRKTFFPKDEGGIILKAELKLKKDDLVKIQNNITRYLSKRNRTQPLNIPNSGSVFKNPDGDKAGRLIEKAGLKGYCVGDAGISIKHANFVVNRGNAHAEDVLQVIDHVHREVKHQTGVELETEIIVVGE